MSFIHCAHEDEIPTERSSISTREVEDELLEETTGWMEGRINSMEGSKGEGGP